MKTHVIRDKATINSNYSSINQEIQNVGKTRNNNNHITTDSFGQDSSGFDGSQHFKDSQEVSSHYTMSQSGKSPQPKGLLNPRIQKFRAFKAPSTYMAIMKPKKTGEQQKDKKERIRESLDLKKKLGLAADPDALVDGMSGFLQ